MLAAATKAKLKTIVACWHNMEESAGWLTIGIVIDGEQPADRIDANAKRIPKSRRHAGQIFSVERDAKDAAPFASPRPTRSVCCQKRVGHA